MHSFFGLDPSVVAAFAFVLYIVSLYGWAIVEEWRKSRQARLRDDTTAPRDTDSDSRSHTTID